MILANVTNQLKEFFKKNKFIEVMIGELSS